jgi:hypothetical protein
MPQRLCYHSRRHLPHATPNQLSVELFRDASADGIVGRPERFYNIFESRHLESTGEVETAIILPSNNRASPLYVLSRRGTGKHSARRFARMDLLSTILKKQQARHPVCVPASNQREVDMGLCMPQPSHDISTRRMHGKQLHYTGWSRDQQVP